MITPENKLVSSIIFKAAHLIEKKHWSVPAFDQSTTTERLIGCINKIKQNSVVNTCSILAVFPQLSKLFHFPPFQYFSTIQFLFYSSMASIKWRLRSSTLTFQFNKQKFENFFNTKTSLYCFLYPFNGSFNFTKPSILFSLHYILLS